jgi:hypothetical protein
MCGKSATFRARAPSFSGYARRFDVNRGRSPESTQIASNQAQPDRTSGGAAAVCVPELFTATTFLRHKICQ